MTEMYTPDLFDEHRRDLTPRHRAHRSAKKKREKQCRLPSKFIVCSSFKRLSRIEKMFSLCEGRICGGYLYIIELGKTVKIGITSNPLQRISDLKNLANNYMLVEMERIAFSYPHKNYRKNEDLLHSVFSKERIGTGELFSVRFERVLTEAESLDIDITGIERAARRQRFETLLRNPVIRARSAVITSDVQGLPCRLSGARTKKEGLPA